MSAGEMLGIEPLEIRLPFELRKQISCSLQLTNKSDNHIAFKVKTTNPKKYCVRPNSGVVLPRSSCDVVVTMQAQKEAPSDTQCKDKFLVQSVIVNPETTTKDITLEMFARESGNNVEEIKLRVLYVSPPQLPSPVLEGSDEDSSLRASLSENGNLKTVEPAGQSNAYAHPEISMDTILISKITEEKNLAIEHNRKLRGELELLRQELGKQRGGSFSIMFVVIVTLLGILAGYLVK